MIDDRMRTPSNGGATVWVYDERRRVRDDVAARLVALPFVGRVEVIGDGASLLARLATRSPDVLLVGTQRAVDTGLASATPGAAGLPGPGRARPRRTRRRGDRPCRRRLRCPRLPALGRLAPIEMGLGLSARRPARRRPGAGRHGHAATAQQDPLPGAGAWNGAAPLNGSSPTTVRSTVREATGVQLSMREMQVLTGMSQGKSNAQIGRELCTCPRTPSRPTRAGCSASWVPRTAPRRWPPASVAA